MYKNIINSNANQALLRQFLQERGLAERVLFWGFILTVGVAWASDALATTGTDPTGFATQVAKIDAFFGGAYMRVALFAVCGFTCVMGAIKQNLWMAGSGVAGAVGAYLMKDWIATTFTCVI